ncbi:MAG: DUF2304 domain-containing protein [Armatimonadota bacterium]
MSMMSPRQAIFTVSLAVLLFVFVVDLVRRRRLREEYSWLWVIASAATLLLVAWPTALRTVIAVSGASKATTTIFMLAIAFLAVVCIHLCTKLTEANERSKKLAQHVALIRRRETPASPPVASPESDKR